MSEKSKNVNQLFRLKNNVHTKLLSKVNIMTLNTKYKLNIIKDRMWWMKWEDLKCWSILWRRKIAFCIEHRCNWNPFPFHFELFFLFRSSTKYHNPMAANDCGSICWFFVLVSNHDPIKCVCVCVCVFYTIKKIMWLRNVKGILWVLFSFVLGCSGSKNRHFKSFKSTYERWSKIF